MLDQLEKKEISAEVLQIERLFERAGAFGIVASLALIGSRISTSANGEGYGVELFAVLVMFILSLCFSILDRTYAVSKRIDTAFLQSFERFKKEFQTIENKEGPLPPELSALWESYKADKRDIEAKEAALGRVARFRRNHSGSMSSILLGGGIMGGLMILWTLA